MHAILESDPPELPPAVLQASPALARIVARCLEKDPAERFHSAHDLGLALESIAAGSGSLPVAVIAPPRRSSLRRIAVWMLIVVVAAAAGALVVALSTERAGEPIRMEWLTYSGHDASPAASPDGKTIAFTSDRDGVPRIWLKQVQGGGELALTDGADDYPRFSPDGSSLIFVRRTATSSSLYRVPLLGGDAHKLLDDVTGADWSPDGHQLAFTRWVSGERSGSIVGVASSDGGGPREIAFVAGRALITPRWSPDGRTIAAVTGLGNVAAGIGIDIVEMSGHARLLISPQPSMRHSSVLWSADSRSVVYSEAESVAAWLTGSSARIVRQDVKSGAARTLAWVPNHSKTLDVLDSGRLLLDTRSSRENLRELPLDDSAGPGERWLTRGNSTDRQPTYSPDGEWLAFSSNRGGNLDLWAVHRANGTVRRLTIDPADDWDVAYSPDGRRLLWGSNRSGPYEVWAANPDGSDAKQLSHDGGFAQNPQQTPNGQWVVYHSTNPAHPGLWRMRSDGRDPVRLYVGAIQLPEISPDGQNVLFVDGLAAKIRVVRLSDGHLVPFEIAVVRRKETTAILGRARWMPDGRAIAFIGQDEHGVNGIFVQDFVPGSDTTGTRRRLGGFDPENSAETFAISPDGKLIAIGGWEQMFNIMIVSEVRGLEQIVR
jgi:Tol biopolymer transport system component